MIKKNTFLICFISIITIFYFTTAIQAKSIIVIKQENCNKSIDNLYLVCPNPIDRNDPIWIEQGICNKTSDDKILISSRPHIEVFLSCPKSKITASETIIFLVPLMR